MSDSYKHLSSFLASWFHQDFDIAGDSIDEILTSYLLSAKLQEIICVRRDIGAFLIEYPESSGGELEEVFGLEVEPLAFASSGKAFLLAIDKRLSEAGTRN